MPTAPAILPTAIVVRARARAGSARARPRRASARTPGPAVIGSAWMPCERPIIGVCACSRARSASAARELVDAPRGSGRARAPVWIASAVSSTSDDVIPRCSQRAGSPASSSTWVRNAMTSWRVRRLDREDALRDRACPRRPRATRVGGAGRARCPRAPSPRTRRARSRATARSGTCRPTARRARVDCSEGSSVTRCTRTAARRPRQGRRRSSAPADQGDVPPGRLLSIGSPAKPPAAPGRRSPLAASRPRASPQVRPRNQMPIMTAQPRITATEPQIT